MSCTCKRTCSMSHTFATPHNKFVLKQENLDEANYNLLKSFCQVCFGQLLFRNSITNDLYIISEI